MLSINCYAKLNLFLKVVGKRSDGFHNLQSLITFIDIYDILSVKIAPNFDIIATGAFADQLPKPSDNIIYHIWQYFCQNFHLQQNIEINLQKNIPIGGGLGGGSSNATAIINAINQLFALNLDKNTLIQIGLKFGSDLPLFFSRQASFIEGRGEVVLPYCKTIPQLPVLLVSPNKTLLTKQVFANNRNISDFIDIEQLQKLDYQQLFTINNDLCESAIAIEPNIGSILTNLNKFKPQKAAMSGSGSVCFAIFDNDKQLNACQDWFWQNFPNYFIKKTQIISSL